ncbi:MAG: hypothetical protein PF484_14675 [Bacteroidales bacterium]|jgi:SprT protein|nr:hypothetical protein [Bacteroidales bacterium]
MNKDKHILINYIPIETVNPLVEWLHKNNVKLKISRTRSTKLGDFRVASNGDFPRISVNHNLNPYAFLITLVHEMAHVEVWNNKSRFRRIQPHGKEWQTTFSNLMLPFLNENIFPETLLPVVKKYFQKPKASSVSDPNLMSALKVFDTHAKNPQLNDLVLGDRFVFRKASFEVVKKMRTRFRCRNMQNNRLFIIHGLAEVEKLPN